MSFRDLSKLLAIALESSRSIPQHLETNVVHFFLQNPQYLFMYTKLQ